MSDKKPLMASKEYGKDEDSTVALIRKHENVQHELSAFKPRITDLQSESQSMLSEGHYDSEAIVNKQVRVCTQPKRKKTTQSDCPPSSFRVTWNPNCMSWRSWLHIVI